MPLIEDIRLARTNDLVSNIGRVSIPSSFKKTAQIRRLISTYGMSGNVVEETYQQVAANHDVCFWPLSTAAIVASEKLGFKVSHAIHPIADVSGWQLGDFYYLNNRLYKITKGDDFSLACHFEVWDGPFSTPAQNINKRYAYAISSLGPGNYTFGSGLLASVPAFSATPQLIEAVQNNALWTVTNITATGFTVVDLGLGAEPSLTVYLWNDLGVTETDRFYVTGLTAGNYTFGSGPLAHIAAFSQTPDVIGAPRNTGWYWISNVTQYGFTVADAGINESPSISVLIRAKPTAMERRWSFSGLGEGSYTFGSGALAGMPSGFVRAPMVLPQPNNSGRVFRPAVTTTGFTITWTGEGVDPSVTVMIQEI